jgi:hypothetical protein
MCRRRGTRNHDLGPGRVPHGFAVRRSFNPLTQFQTTSISSSAVDSTIRNRPSAATSYPARPARRVSNVPVNSSFGESTPRPGYVRMRTDIILLRHR